MVNSIMLLVIEAVQLNKKQLVNTFIKHDEFADACCSFIDKQTEYTVGLLDAMTHLGHQFYGFYQDRGFPMQFVESYIPCNKPANKKTKKSEDKV